MKPSLVGLMLTMFMASLDTSIANAGLPSISHAFSAPFHMVQWVVLAYLLVVTTFIVSIGKLGDFWGRKRLLIGGIAVFTLASVACGLAPNLIVLIAARAIQGLGAAAMLALTMTFVAETVPPERKGWAMGLMGTMSALGTALGPTLGGLLMSRFGWPAIFLVNLPIGLINLYLVHSFLKNDVVKTAPKFDIFGTAILGSGLACYALSLTLESKSSSAVNVLLGGLALILFTTFVLIQRRSSEPLISINLISSKSIGAGLIMSFAVSAVIMTTLVVGPFYLSKGLMLNEVSVGILLSIGPAVVALLGPQSGKWADKYGARRVSSIGIVLMIVGGILMCIVPISMGVTGYIANIVFITSGYAIFQTSNNSILMSEGTESDKGVVSGLMSLTRNLGLITGAAAMGALFSMAAGSIEMATPQALSTALRATFAGAVTLLLIGLSIAWFLKIKTNAIGTAHANLNS